MTSTSLRDIFAGLALPMIVAPMTAVSTPGLVAAACANGVMGAFPTNNCRSGAELDEWFAAIAEQVRRDTPAGAPPGALIANLIVSKANARLEDDIACVVRHRVPIVITSVGNPAPYIGDLRAGGCRVLVDVASIAHVHKALAAGADGLVLLSAGAGGHTGWANPFAFVRAVRHVFDGPLVLAGGMSDGAALWGAITLGYDAGMFGTRFIATDESGAPDAWRQAILDATMDDITLDAGPTGVPASLLRNGGGSGGHTVSSVHRHMTAAEVIAAIRDDWDQARARTAALL
jgi:nitronate monooxygenase